MDDTNKRVAGVGAGLLATAAVAAAGYYFYASKDARKNRRIVVKWAGDLKGDVMRKASKLGTIDRDSVVAAIDQVMDAYESVKGIKRTDLERAARELKDNWQTLARELQRAHLSKRVTRKSPAAQGKRAPAARKRTVAKS